MCCFVIRPTSGSRARDWADGTSRAEGWRESSEFKVVFAFRNTPAYMYMYFHGVIDINFSMRYILYAAVPRLRPHDCWHTG